MARRGENIFKRRDGRWEARVAEYRENGQKAYRSLYGRTYAETKAKKEEYFSHMCGGRPPATRKTAAFSWLADRWLASVKSTVKESTYTRYYRTVHSYLMPQFGKYAVIRLDSAAVDRFKDELLTVGGRRGGGLAEKTVTDILSVLKLILAYATDEGYPALSASLIRNPRRRGREIQTIPPEKLDQLEDILPNSDNVISLGILLTLHTGIRAGELCGLRWEDVYFNSKTVRIRRTVERIADLDPLTPHKTKVIISEPKTVSSRRELPLPQALCRYLNARRGAPETYILTGMDKPSEPHTLYVRYERFLRRHGFEDYTFHALRHTFATRGIEAGVDVKSLSELLGHSDVTTTLRCYVHPSAEQKRQQMEAMFDERIRGQKYGRQEAEKH